MRQDLPRIQIANYRDIDRGRLTCAFDLILPDVGVRVNDISYIELQPDTPYTFPWIPFVDARGRAEKGKSGRGWRGYRAGKIDPSAPINKSLSHVLAQHWCGGPIDPAIGEVLGW